MQGDVVLIVILLVLGCAAFFFGVIYVICRFLAWMGRGVWSFLRPCRSTCSPAGGRLRSRPVICPNERCRKTEYRYARYCSQCGTRLAQTAAGDES